MNGDPHTSGINPLDSAAQRLLGVSYLYPYQKLVVANSLEGRDQIVILPTGAGKSLCFQLPAQLLRGATLVVFPLLALIADQERRLRESGVGCMTIRGGQSTAERDACFEAARNGTARLLLATPEALLSPSVFERLPSLSIAQLVVDEAHCVSEWGETFRPGYLELGMIAESARIPVVTAFTATASPLVLDKIRAHLFQGRNPTLVMGSPDRPNIFYNVVPTLSKDREVVRLARSKARPLIVFCRSRVGAELTARLLRRRLSSEDVFFYHAGLLKVEKQAVERWFFDSTSGVLAATCAYGMGIDKQSIRTVIHRDLPPSIEAFLQESGRAGRDGLPSESFVLVAPGDRTAVRRIKDPLGRQRYEALLEATSDRDRCRRNGYLSLLGAEPTVCFGCDVCRGTTLDAPEGERLIRRFVSINLRRYSVKEAGMILSGERSYETRRRRVDSALGNGLLGDWERAEIEEAIGNLVLEGKLRVAQRGFWKRRLTRSSRLGHPKVAIARRARGK